MFASRKRYFRAILKVRKNRKATYVIVSCLAKPAESNVTTVGRNIGNYVSSALGGIYYKAKIFI